MALFELLSTFFWLALVLFFVWYLFLTDCDTILAIAEKFGRPVSGFAGKVVWVTGASTGLGEAMAYELASVGAKLILTARNKDLLQKVKEECIVLLTSRFEATRGLFLDGPSNFEPRSGDEDDT
ncbi:hypothetical protein AVEN_126619-1 [Araneus ventricosus]|uniref:Dehydrogenase/reductase SDR family member 7 n=1 Tax=Araneus ventricosus TaxID=182803 RepID=A0A4Y2S1Q0_ARAVE|nr:hypothetical protein AVEN_126619-1 [Araneus ventricosus]